MNDLPLIEASIATIRSEYDNVTRVSDHRHESVMAARQALRERLGAPNDPGRAPIMVEMENKAEDVHNRYRAV